MNGSWECRGERVAVSGRPGDMLLSRNSLPPLFSPEEVESARLVALPTRDLFSDLEQWRVRKWKEEGGKKGGGVFPHLHTLWVVDSVHLSEIQLLQRGLLFTFSRLAQQAVRQYGAGVMGAPCRTQWAVRGDQWTESGAAVGASGDSVCGCGGGGAGERGGSGAVLKYRTYDGTCNNFFFPLNGAAVTPFPRLLPAEYEDGISAPVGLGQALSGDARSPPWPSPRLISWKVVRNSSESAPSGITHMVMQWGQFLDHDIDLSPVFDVECGCSHTRRCIPIPVDVHDGMFGNDTVNSGKCLSFSRSIPACQLESAASLPRGQINQVTSFIDGSQVYGSSQELALSLRLMTGGLLKQGGRAKSHKGNLPFQEERTEGGVLPFFIAGDERANEQTGLTVMHTLWLREHNRITRDLAAINPCWDDERLYQEARKIVAAQMQKISYDEFLPTIFGDYMDTYVSKYSGYNPFVNASIPNSFAAAAYRFGHSLIRNQLLRLDENFTATAIGHLPLARAFFNPVAYFEGRGTDYITRGLMVDISNPVDEFLNSVLTSKLFSKKPGELGGDLASLNIQRGRDHGLPSYRSWQRYCQRVFPGHNATFGDSSTEQLLRQLYGERGFREGMDLWVGGLAEERLPGAQVGPTNACILGVTFSRLP